MLYFFIHLAQQKKEREIKKKMKQEMVVSVNISRPIRLTRSCRNRKPATYTFGKVILLCGCFPLIW